MEVMSELEAKLERILNILVDLSEKLEILAEGLGLDDGDFEEMDSDTEEEERSMKKIKLTRSSSTLHL